MAFLSAALGSLSLSTIATGASVAGTLLSGYSAYAAGNYQNKVAVMNAKVAEQNATEARNRSQREAAQQDALTLGMLGEQEAAQSASGLSITGKSQVLTRKAAARLGRIDTLNVIEAGNREAYNYKVDATNQLAQGKLAKASGTSSLLGSFLGAGASLVGGSQSTKRTGMYDPWNNRKDGNLRRVTV